jgi:hypothetical protein
LWHWGGAGPVGPATGEKKAPLARRLRSHISFGCWFMLEFLGIRVVSSALGMQGTALHRVNEM